MESNLVSIGWKREPSGIVYLYLVYPGPEYLENNEYVYVWFFISKEEVEFRKTLINEAIQSMNINEENVLKVLEMKDKKNNKVILIWMDSYFHIEYLNHDKQIKIPHTLDEKMSRFLSFLIHK
jgi:hypothetical protein